MDNPIHNNLFPINYDSDLINDSFTQHYSSSISPAQFSENDTSNSLLRPAPFLENGTPEPIYPETQSTPPDFYQILSNYDSRQQSYLGNKHLNYDEIFNKIREKLYFKKNEQSTQDFSQIGQSEEFNILKNIKDKISKLYIKKIEIDEKINLAKKNIKLFTDTINNTITFFNEIEYDPNLKDLLNKKIDSYFLYNNIENLTNESLMIDKELEESKSLITLFSSFLPSVACSICFDKQVEYFMDPCGHSVCKDCKIKCEVSNKCHYCRTVRKKFNKLYLS